MTEIHFQKAAYAGLSYEETEHKLIEQGYRPELVTEPKNTSEEPHIHQKSYLVVHVLGDMTVSDSNHDYKMKPGDAVVILGGIEHTAIFGKNGAKYFWTILQAS